MYLCTKLFLLNVLLAAVLVQCQLITPEWSGDVVQHNFRGTLRKCREIRCPIGSVPRICSAYDTDTTYCDACDAREFFMNHSVLSTQALECYNKQVCAPNDGLREVANRDNTCDRQCGCMTELGYYQLNWYSAPDNRYHRPDCRFCVGPRKYVHHVRGCMECDGTIVTDTDGYKDCSPHSSSTTTGRSFADMNDSVGTALKVLNKTSTERFAGDSSATEEGSHTYITVTVLLCAVVIIIVGIILVLILKKKICTQEQPECMKKSNDNASYDDEKAPLNETPTTIDTCINLEYKEQPNASENLQGSPDRSSTTEEEYDLQADDSVPGLVNTPPTAATADTMNARTETVAASADHSEPKDKNAGIIVHGDVHITMHQDNTVKANGGPVIIAQGAPLPTDLIDGRQAQPEAPCAEAPSGGDDQDEVEYTSTCEVNHPVQEMGEQQQHQFNIDTARMNGHGAHHSVHTTPLKTPG